MLRLRLELLGLGMGMRRAWILVLLRGGGLGKPILNEFLHLCAIGFFIIS
jgi:hypothetical protein